MKEFKDHHFLIKVGNLYLSNGSGSSGFSFTTEMLKSKAMKMDEETTTHYSKRLSDHGLSFKLIRVDEVTTITETEIGSVEVKY